MNLRTSYQPTITIALILSALLSFYSNTYSSDKINIDSLLAEAEKEEFIEPEISDCNFGFDILDDGFPYEGEIFKDIAEEIDYSNINPHYLSKDTNYRVIVKVLIDTTGKIAESKIEYSSGISSFDKEAQRVANSLKNWTQPIQDGQPISLWLSFPVQFRIKE